jgi:hypothetical protein
MVRAVRQTVTVGPGGSVELRSAELPVGSRAEVIVLVDSPPAVPTQREIADRLAALDEIQRRLALTPEATEAWLKQIREEREASTDRILRRDQ